MIKKFIKSELASISIYVLIIVALFIGTLGSLIDLARIHLAKRQMELASQSAIRSVASNMNEQLLPYGLFSFSIEDSEIKETIRSLTEDNLTDSVLNTTLMIDDIHANRLHSLANHSVFMQQILEKMKYIAPIEVTREVFEKIVPIEEEAQQFHRRSQSAEELHILWEKREKVLGVMWEHVGELNSSLEQFKVKIANLIAAQTGSDEEDEEEDDAQKEIDWTKIQQETEQLHLYVSEQFKQFMVDFDEAKQLNKELYEKIIQYETAEEATNYDVYPEDYFTTYQVRYSSVVSSIQALYHVAQQRESLHSASEANLHYASLMRSWYNELKVEEEQRKHRLDQIETQQEELKQSVKEEINESEEIIERSLPCQDSDRTYYEQLHGNEGLVQSYVQYNAKKLEATVPFEMSSVPPNQLGQVVANLFQTIQAKMVDIRDHLYVNEYALFYFSNRTSSEAGGHRLLPQSRYLNQHVLQNQEVEFILYGFSSCQSNLRAAYAEIFALRTAIRTIEAYFTSSINAAASVTPLTKILAALVEGMIKAKKDMNELLEGKSIEVSAKLPKIQMSYQDYLRLFFILHSNNTSVLSRIQALLTLNLQVDLYNEYTMMMSQTTGNIRLFILGPFFHVLNKSSGDAHVPNYKFIQQTTFSY